MKLIITSFVRKNEVEPLSDLFSIEIIKAAAKKAIIGPGKTVKSSVKLAKTCLRKIHITSPSGAGRAIFLFHISSQKTVLVMLRLKKDKKIGNNMSIQNPKFKSLLERNISNLLKDLAKQSYEEFDL